MSNLKELLQIPDFRRLWTAQAISFFGDSLTIFGLLFLTQRLTGNAASVAGVLIAMSLPMLVVGLGAGRCSCWFGPPIRCGSSTWLLF